MHKPRVYPEPKSIVVFDNAPIHHGRRIEALCENQGDLEVFLTHINRQLMYLLDLQE